MALLSAHSLILHFALIALCKALVPIGNPVRSTHTLDALLHTEGALCHGLGAGLGVCCAIQEHSHRARAGGVAGVAIELAIHSAHRPEFSSTGTCIYALAGTFAVTCQADLFAACKAAVSVCLAIYTTNSLA